MRPVALTPVLPLLLAACQAEPGTSAQAAASPQADPSAPALTPAQQAFAEANARMHAGMEEIPADPDEAFMRGMLAHHRGAVEMAEVALRHGTNPEVRALARHVIDSQTAEIAQMEAWLAARNLPAAPSEALDDPHAGHH